MPGLRRGTHTVVRHVEILDRSFSQITRLRRVEAVKAHGIEAVALRIGASRERPHAALNAEGVVEVLSPELVVAQALLAGNQAERIRRNPCEPGPRLEADRAVAPEGALCEVDVGLVAHRAAVAAAAVGLLHRPASIESTLSG